MTTKLAPPPLSYGAVRQNLPSAKSFARWASLTAIFAGMVIVTFNASPKIVELGYQLGNRTNWSWAELALGFTIPAGIAWFFYTIFFLSEPSDRFRTDIYQARFVYAVQKVKPWIKKNYGVTVSDDDAENLLRGWTAHVYRTNEQGVHEYVNVRLQGANNLDAASWNTDDYDPYGVLRLLIIPDPTTPPAPFEFVSFDKVAAA